ncbi:hypothetical protein AB4Y87_14035 [Paenarthrobacter sp. RAF54_2]|uniref:hypothetical protein n=1 Tax=Paenarthrobacter sp. RAF54_2 TaxID=3233061 RepID=UPI003F9E26D6
MDPRQWFAGDTYLDAYYSGQHRWLDRLHLEDFPPGAHTAGTSRRYNRTTTAAKVVRVFRPLSLTKAKAVFCFVHSPLAWGHVP